MAEQIVIIIDRPNVGVHYKAATPEAETRDQLAASELALHALAQKVRDLHSTLGLACPPVVLNLASSDLWRLGM